MSYVIRQATIEDVPQIRDIYNYFVQNTTISMMLHEPNEDYIATRFWNTTARQLPYLVAVVASPSDTSSSQHLRPKETVLGYCHVSPFSPDKAGYRNAVELTLYVRPEHISAGIGSALMTRLLDQLKLAPYSSWEAGQESKRQLAEETRVKQVYAIMSTDVAGRGGWIAKGEKVKQWYESKFGFREVGRLKDIGEKFGHSVDVIYLCKRLDDGGMTEI